jgi:phosphatidate cytidylyltransferase
LNKKNLLTRASVGAVYIAIILLGIFGGGISFLAVFGIITGIGLFEFYRMVEKNTTHAISKIFNIASGMLIFLSVFLYLEGVTPYALLVVVLLYLLILFLSAVCIPRKDIFHAITYSVFGQMYVTMPLSLLMFVRYQFSYTLVGYYYAFILALFVFIWINDTGAYIVGSLFGKHKLNKRISPKKTVEGFIGGIVFTVLASFVFIRFVPVYPIDSYLFWAVFAIIVALFGTLGDLFESLIKRTCSVKDSGDIMPGHGGILDRIDSLLIVVPAVYIFLLIVFGM